MGGATRVRASPRSGFTLAHGLCPCWLVFSSMVIMYWSKGMRLMEYSARRS